MTSLAGTYIPFNINLFFTVYKNYLTLGTGQIIIVILLHLHILLSPADVLNHSGNK